MRELFTPKAFSDEVLTVIEQADAILQEYDAAGFELSLRGVYYQFVARDLFPDNRRYSEVGKKWVRDPNGTKNAVPNYKWMGKIISDARLAGLIDWELIVDRLRPLEKLPTWRSAQSILQISAQEYRTDKWKDQPTHVEVWIEKDALAGVIEGICEELEVPYLACRGYMSQTALYEAGLRIRDAVHKRGQDVVVIHLGDHDPSGIDMTRDITDRLDLFAGTRGATGMIDVRRIALNMDQIELYDPPPNPAKTTDSRSAGYIAEFGHESWELDALDPEAMVDLIRDEVLNVRNDDVWNDSVEAERDDQEFLNLLVDADQDGLVDFMMGRD